MSDLLGGILGGLGVQQDELGGGFSLGGSLERLGAGIADVFDFSPLGLVQSVKRVPELFTDEDVPTYQKVAAGAAIGLGVAGVAGGLRRYARTRFVPESVHVNASIPEPDPFTRQELDRKRGLLRLGREVKSPPIAGLTGRAKRLTIDMPGELYAGDPVRTGALSGLIDSYRTPLGVSREDATLDFVRAQTVWEQFHAKKRGEGWANRSGLSGRSQEFQGLWRKVVEDPTTLTAEEAAKVNGFVGELATVMDSWAASPGLTLSPTVRFTHVGFGDDGVEFALEQAKFRFAGEWKPTDVQFSNSLKQFLERVDYRTMADEADRNMRALYTLGMTIWNGAQPRQIKALLANFAQQGVEFSMEIDPAKLSLDLGPDWYRLAGQQAIDGKTAAGLKITDDQMLVATSILSDAEDWKTNVPKAVEVAKLATDPRFSDPGFVEWVRNFKPAKGEGKEARLAAQDVDGHLDTLNELHRLVRQAGFGKVSLQNLAKVFTALHADDPWAALGDAGGPKQRWFAYLLRHPEDPNGVVVDRHAFDGAFGVDLGGADRPGASSVGEDPAWYELISDVIRGIASDQGVTPNQVQAVTWEIWKALKGAAIDPNGGKRPGSYGGLSRQDPFHVKGASLWDAISGKYDDRMASRAIPSAALPDRPLSIVPEVIGDQVVVAGGADGVAIYGATNPQVAAQLRHMYPDMAPTSLSQLTTWDPKKGEPVARWLPGKPLQVADLDFHTGRVAEHQPSTTIETFDGSLTQLGLAPGDRVTVDTDNEIVAKKAARMLGGKAVRLPVQSDAPARTAFRFAARDLDPHEFVDPEAGPLVANHWVAISAELSDERRAALGIDQWDNATKTNLLEAKLRAAGYEPIRQRGDYGGEETSFLVPGMTPTEAMHWARAFEQESVATPDGLLYTHNLDSPELNGTLVPAKGLIFDDGLQAFYSETEIGGIKRRWSVDLDWEGDPVPIEDLPSRTTSNPSRWVIELPPQTGRDVIDQAHQLLESNGGKRISWYLSDQMGPTGTSPAREYYFTQNGRVATYRVASGEIHATNGVTVHTSDRLERPSLRSKPAYAQGPSATVPFDHIVGTGYLAGYKAQGVGPRSAGALVYYGKDPATGLPILDEDFSRKGQTPLAKRYRSSGQYIWALEEGGTQQDLADFSEAARQYDLDYGMPVMDHFYDGGGVMTTLPAERGRTSRMLRTVSPKVHNAIKHIPGVSTRGDNAMIAIDRLNGRATQSMTLALADKIIAAPAAFEAHVQRMQALADRLGSPNFYIDYRFSQPTIDGMVRAFERVDDLFPGAFGKIYGAKGITIGDSVKDGVGITGYNAEDVLGYAVTHTKGNYTPELWLNGSAFADDGYSEARYRAATTTRHFPTLRPDVGPAEALLTHELGHVVHNALRKMAGAVEAPGNKTMMSGVSAPHVNIDARRYHALQKLEEFLLNEVVPGKTFISNYARTNVSEAFAETFTNALLGIDSSPAGLRLLATIEAIRRNP